MREDRRHPDADGSQVELLDLLADYATGEMTGGQDARIQELAIESEDASRLYLQYMFMYGSIHRKQGNRDKLDAALVPPLERDDETPDDPPSPSANSAIFPLLEMENDLLSSCSDTDEFGASKKTDADDVPTGGIFGNINFSFVPGLISIVSAFLILSVVVILPIYWSTQSKEAGWDIVARVAQTVDCQWKQGSVKPTTGSFLATGQKLELELGLAELEFASGVRVILQGPAEFMIHGKNLSALQRGQLTAIVPSGAEGFTVKAPGIDVVDLGTEFGVAVNSPIQSDVHVFKGLVEMEADTKSGQSKKIRLKKNEAVEYSKKSGQIVPVPIDTKKFVRTLSDHKGVTANLRVTNAGFEVPDIRTVSEYQSSHGNALFRPIYGWKMSDLNQSKSRVAMYQISPFHSPIANSDIAPPATDGRQVAMISLGAKGAVLGRQRSNWIYQSLGFVVPDDVGKTLKLAVDAGPAKAYGGLPRGEGTVTAGFALNVTNRKSGTVVGKPDSFYQKEELKQLHCLTATLPIAKELIGKELFIVLAVSDDGSSHNIDPYLFDNVRLSVEN